MQIQENQTSSPGIQSSSLAFNLAPAVPLPCFNQTFRLIVPGQLLTFALSISFGTFLLLGHLLQVAFPDYPSLASEGEYP